MKLYVTGCSHTSGTYLSLPNANDRYAEVLRNKYGYDVTYEARPGASNERIFRKAIENLTLSIEQDGTPFKYAVFQWTTIDRFETPIYPKEGWMKSYKNKLINDWTDHRPWSAQWSQRRKFDIPFRKYYNQCYFKIVQFEKNRPSSLKPEQREELNILMGVQKRLEQKMFAQMLAADGFFKSMGVEKVLHMNFDPITRPHKNPLYNSWKSNLTHMFDADYGMDFILPTYGHERCMSKDVNDSPGTVDGHFMADAHAHIADWVHGFITGELNEPIKRSSEPEEQISQGQWLRENQFND